MSQWDEHELFGEGYLTKRHQTAQVVESSSPRTNEKRKGDDMEHRLARPMCAPDAPPLWRCNARKQHYPNGIECREIIEKAPTIQRRAAQQEECDGQEDEGEGGGPPGGGGT